MTGQCSLCCTHLAVGFAAALLKCWVAICGPAAAPCQRLQRLHCLDRPQGHAAWSVTHCLRLHHHISLMQSMQFTQQGDDGCTLCVWCPVGHTLAPSFHSVHCMVLLLALPAFCYVCHSVLLGMYGIQCKACMCLVLGHHPGYLPGTAQRPADIMNPPATKESVPCLVHPRCRLQEPHALNDRRGP